MLRLKSFEMTDEQGMNDCLGQCVLAEKSAVFVSNGRIVLQIEDGIPMTNAQKMVDAKEKRNKKMASIDIINHAQRVLDVKIENVEKQIFALEEKVAIPGDKKSYDSKKTNEEAIKRLKSIFNNFLNEEIGLKAELDSIIVEIDIYNETISDLENFLEAEK